MDDLNKLKMNEAKTEFIVVSSPMLKHDLSDLTVNVNNNNNNMVYRGVARIWQGEGQ